MPREFASNADYLRRVKQEYGNADLIDLVESIEQRRPAKQPKYPPRGFATLG
jgi:hypothetical protein